MFINKAILCSLVTLIISCGSDDSSQPSPAPVYSLAVDSSQLPECAPANVHQLVFETDTKLFKTCSEDGTWLEIDTAENRKLTTEDESPGDNCEHGGLKVTSPEGEVSYVCDGAPGVDGTDGVNGEDGTPGVGLKLIESWEYHTNTYEHDVAESGALYVGDITVSVFDSGLIHVSVSGTGLVTIGGVGKVSDYAHEYWQTETPDTPISKQFKVWTNALVTINYTLHHSSDGTYSLEASQDVDGDLTNNTQTTVIPLTNTVE